MFITTYKAINSSICAVRIEDIPTFEGLQAAQPEDQETLIQRIVMYYSAVAPCLM